MAGKFNWKQAFMFVIFGAILIFAGEWILNMTGLTGVGIGYEILFLVFPLFLFYLVWTKYGTKAKR